MLDALEDFRHEGERLRRYKFEKNNGQETFNRMIEFEICDMADRMESMQYLVETQNGMMKEMMGKIDAMSKN